MNCSHFLAGFQTGNHLYKSHDLGWTSLCPSPCHLIDVVLRAHRYLTWEVFAFLKKVLISLAVPWLCCLCGALHCGSQTLAVGRPLARAPRSGMEPASPAPQDGFLTTGPPGQSQRGDASRERKQMGLSFSRMVYSLEFTLKQKEFGGRGHWRTTQAP